MLMVALVHDVSWDAFDTLSAIYRCDHILDKYMYTPFQSEH